jgi:DNA-binding transcriptional ArsR family regulator
VSVALLERPDDVRMALSPLRRRLLERLREPASAAQLAAELGVPRQKLGYHLRLLEQAGLVGLVEQRRRRGCQERILQASAGAFVVDPAVLSGDPVAGEAMAADGESVAGEAMAADGESVAARAGSAAGAVAEGGSAAGAPGGAVAIGSAGKPVAQGIPAGNSTVASAAARDRTAKAASAGAGVVSGPRVKVQETLRAGDRHAAEHLITVSAGTVREVTRMRAAADKQGKRLLTFTIEAAVNLGAPADLHHFSDALASAVAEVVASFDSSGGRPYRLVIGGHPASAGGSV